jgi:hypothetical protein
MEFQALTFVLVIVIAATLFFFVIRCSLVSGGTGNNGQMGLAPAVNSKRTITAEARMVRVVILWNAQPGLLYLKGCQEAGLSNPLPGSLLIKR